MKKWLACVRTAHFLAIILRSLCSSKLSRSSDSLRLIYRLFGIPHRQVIDQTRTTTVRFKVSWTNFVHRDGLTFCTVQGNHPHYVGDVLSATPQKGEGLGAENA